jgi:hypothetical protein
MKLTAPCLVCLAVLAYGCTGGKRNAPGPSMIEAGMEYSVAARRLRSWGKTEGSSALDIQTPPPM